MYKQVIIDLKKYEPVYEYPVGRIEYNFINMPKQYPRNGRAKFEYKRCIFEPDMHLGEMTACKIAEKIGIPCCEIELFKKPHSLNPRLFETGSISYFDLSSDEFIHPAENIVKDYCRANNISNDYMADIDTIFAAIYERYKRDNRPVSEFLKFKRDFIMMTVFDLKFGNYDRGLNNWYLRRNNKTGYLDLYPMFDNEAILGFVDDVLEDKSYSSIAEFNNMRKSKVTMPKDREKREYTDFRELYRYLLENYPMETVYATNRIAEFSEENLNDILDRLPDVTQERKDFAKRNFSYRKMTMDRIYEDYLDKKQRRKIKTHIDYPERLTS